MDPCKNIEVKLLHFVNNVLEADEKKKLNNHIKSCEKCMKKYDKIKKLESKMHDPEHFKAPDRFKIIMQKAKERKETAEVSTAIRSVLFVRFLQRLRAMKGLSIAALLVVLVFSLFFLL